MRDPSAEAAALGGYHVEHIRRLISRGKIKARKWGRDWQVDRADLLAYIRGQEKLGAKLTLKRIAVRDTKKDREVTLDSGVLTDDFESVLDDHTRVLGPLALAAFYRKSALERVGLFGSRFGDRLSTVDLGLTLQEAGYRSTLFPSCRMLTAEPPRFT